jgi:hypothetical protein
VTADDREVVLAASRELVEKVMAENGLAQDDVVSIVFTATRDIVSVAPALAAQPRGRGRDLLQRVLKDEPQNPQALVLAGTDNDYSVTQNGPNNDQFDVYYRFSDANPDGTSIKCPLGTTAGCSGAATSVPGDGSYKLLPGVLHAYKVSATELAGYTAPVPEPESWAMLMAGLGLIGFAARRRQAK